MNYKLFDGAENNYSNETSLKIQILKNRGVENIDKYLKLDESVLHDYKLLDRIDLAVECLDKHISKGSNIHVLVDPDVDGNTSAAMIINYIVKTLKYDRNKISYSIHTQKQHGLSPDIEIPDNADLVIIPDAGSNDYEQLKELKAKGKDIIILDHHEAEKVSEDAIVINNQLCDYPNKNLCGAGVAYKFLQALDDFYWTSGADDYLDLVAWANISDSMDIREPETKYLIDKGLQNIKNKCFKALIDKRSYDIQGQININNIAFYVTPLVNATIRVGDASDKGILFQAILEEYTTFKYKKRGEDELIDEPIFERVARVGTNLKAKQGREMEKVQAELIKVIENENLDKNNILVLDATKYSQTLSGLAAIKIAERFGKPCLVVRENENNKFGGSGRNPDYSPITDLKTYLQDTGLIEAEGHPNAFGIINFNKDNLEKLIEVFNKDNSLCGKLYHVDFVVPFEDLTDSFVFGMNLLKPQYGQKVKESLVCIKDIDVSPDDIELVGKNLDTVKITLDGIVFIKFKCNLDEPLNAIDKDVKINVVGKCSIDKYNGVPTPQIIIEDYEIVE